MFNFLKKSKFTVVSPANGKLKAITEVHDEAFSSKGLGDGFAVEPENGEVYSPVDGTITLVFATKHAIGIKCDNGTEILVHIGVDTVELEGEGFETFVSEGQKISAGQLLSKFDIENIKNKVPSTDIIIVFTSGESCEVLKNGQRVTVGETDIVDVK
jgi:PTS system glucose-specific IIA component